MSSWRPRAICASPRGGDRSVIDDIEARFAKPAPAPRREAVRKPLLSPWAFAALRGGLAAVISGGVPAAASGLADAREFPHEIWARCLRRSALRRALQRPDRGQPAAPARGLARLSRGQQGRARRGRPDPDPADGAGGADADRRDRHRRRRRGLDRGSRLSRRRGGVSRGRRRGRRHQAGSMGHDADARGARRPS